MADSEAIIDANVPSAALLNWGGLAQRLFNLSQMEDSELSTDQRFMSLLRATLHLTTSTDGADKRWKAGLLRALNRALQSADTNDTQSELGSPVLSRVSRALVVATKAAGVMSNRSHACIDVLLVLVDAVCTINSASPEHAEKCTEFLQALVTLIGKVLLCVPAPSRESTSAAYATNAMLVEKHKLLALMAYCWLNNDAEPLLFSVMAMFVRAGGGGVVPQAIRQQLVSALATNVLGAKSPQTISPKILSRIDPFVRSLAASDWTAGGEDSLEATAQRLLKKAPEGASRLLRAICAAIDFPLDSFATTGGVAGCLRMLKSTSSDTRAHGRALLVTLVLKCGSASSTAAAVEEAMAVLTNRATSTAGQRIEVSIVLTNLADLCLGRADIKDDVSSTVGASILAAVLGPAGLLAKEVDDSARVLLAGIAGPWLAAQDTAAACAPLQKLVEGGLTGKAQLAHLMVLSTASERSSNFLAHFDNIWTPLTAPLVKPLQALRAECVLALRVLLQAATVSESAAAALKAGKFWDAISKDTSYVHHIVPFLPAAERDGSAEEDIVVASARAVEAAVTVARGAIIAHARRMPKTTLFSIPAERSVQVRSLELCLLHPSASVRRSVNAHCKELQQNCPGASSALVWGLLARVQDAAKAAQEARPSSTNFKEWASVSADSPPPPPAQWTAPFNRIASAVQSLAENLPVFQVSSVEASELLAGLLLLSCHPGATAGSMSKTRALWVSFRIEALSTDANAIFGDDICVRLVGEKLKEAAGSLDDASRFTATTALRLISAMAREGGKGHWSEQLWRFMGAALQQSATDASNFLQNISAEDMRLYTDAAGVLAEALAAAQSKTVDIKITNADRKKTDSKTARKGGAGFGADLADDEDWVNRIKEEKMKKAQETHGAAVDEVNTVLRSRIAAVGATINAKKAEACGVLNSITALLGGYAGDASTGSALLPVLLPLLTNELVAKEADALLRCLVQATLQGALEDSADDVCNSLHAVSSTSRVFLSRNAKFASEAAFNIERMQRLMRRAGPLVRVLRAAATASGRSSGRGLPAGTFMVLFPILEALLSLPTSLPGCDMVFQVLADSMPSDSSLGAALHPAQELCLRAMRKARVEPKPEGVLQLMCVRNCTRVSDWTPLIGVLGLLSEEAEVRSACLRILQKSFETLIVAGSAACARVGETTDREHLAVHLLLGKCDSVPEVAALGGGVWESWTTLCGAADGGLGAESFLPGLLPLFAHKLEAVRSCAARAVAHATLLHSATAQAVLKKLQATYTSALPEKLDASVRGARALADDNYGTRVAVGVALASMGAQKVLTLLSTSSKQQQDELMAVVKFIATVGAGDRHADVRDAMLHAGRAIVEAYGEVNVQPMLAFFGAELRRPAAKDEDMGAYDARHETCVVLLGSAAKFMPAEDLTQMQEIVATLVGALKIPSEGVQVAVADCLAPLVARMKGSEEAKEQFEALLLAITDSETYGERRGAAFGVSAFVKGLGIVSLKAHNVVSRLKESCESGSNNARQGSLSAFECLSGRLGLLFEPYVVTIVPVLLKSFSHTSDHVREAAQTTARAIMGRLSAHGIKQVLTPILASLPTEPAWKTRQESIRLLGTMAHCAPKQLAACLPQIVPRLVEAGSDPHPKVKESAKLAMEDVTTVIRNPEVSRLSPMLLAALADPANKTKGALEALLECEFMHSIDAPSLALLVPILARALRDRGADLKRKSSAITGNMVSMVSDSKFLLPYLTQLLPGLKDCLVDPIPDVRATASKALGSLVGGVGETDELQELVPWLMITLCTESSPVERSGAAQGLAEICCALGGARLADVLKQTLPLRNSQSFAAREGLLWLMSFLPNTMPQIFAQHISVTLPIVLGGLSDSTESVREIALRAGQVMVNTLGHQYTSELLPSLCDGMFDEDWRIRHASITLVGELMYLVGETKAVTGDINEDDEEDVEFAGSTSKVLANIKNHIGNKLTDSILASLYISRNDVSGPCRQSALQVWKSVVTNTPRVMVEVMGELVLQIVQKLASDNEDMRLVAGRALGDTVSKLGDRILPTVMPYMSRGLLSEDQGMRQGVCLGLAEILNSSSKRQIEDYVDVLVPALQQGFCDPTESVRKQAAKAFQTLFKAIGQQAIHTIVPSLMSRIKSVCLDADAQVESDTALLGLRELLGARPRDVVEFIVPTALRSPMTSHGCYVLGGLASASGKMFQFHVTQLVTSFVKELTRLDALHESGNEDAGSLLLEVKDCASKCMGALTSESVNVLMQELAKQVDHDEFVTSRRWGSYLVEQFVSGSAADYRDYLPLLLKGQLSRVAETNVPLLDAVRCALSAIAEKVSMDRLLMQLEFIRSCIASTASDAKHRHGGEVLLNESGQLELPLLSLPKALDPFLAIYNHGLVNGSPEKREACADAMGEIFKMTPDKALKPYLIKSTGPLIRVAGDRFPSSVKTAILSTLCVLLNKGGVALKAFAPQLQTTFVKALSDAAKQTRQKAVAGLGLLMGISVRTDALLTELSAACSSAESNAIRSSILEALGEALRTTSTTPTAASVEKVRTTVIAYLLSEEEEALRTAACQCLRSLAAHMEEEQVVDCVSHLINQGKSSNISTIIGSMTGGAAIFVGAGPTKGAETQDSLFALIEQGISHEKPTVKMAACGACGVLWAADGSPGADAANAALNFFVETIARVAGDAKNDDDVRKAAVLSMKVAAKGAGFGKHTLSQRLVVRMAPALYKCNRELDPQLQYHAGRALNYLFRRPIGSTTNINDAITNISDAEVVNFLRDFSKRKASYDDDVDSDDDGEESD